MSTDLVTRTDDDLASMLGLNLRDPKTRAMIAVCQQYEFDPLLKHVVVIPQGGVYITRDGLLHVAHRSGQLDGIVIESGPDLVDGEWRCVVSVYRKDMGRPFTFPGRYSASGGNRKYAPEMAIKVAESMALRRAFDVSGLGIVDELQPDDEPPARRPERSSAPQADDPWATQPVDVTEAEVIEDGTSAAPAMDATREAMGLPTRSQGGISFATQKQVGAVAGIARKALAAAGVACNEDARTDLVLVSEFIGHAPWLSTLKEMSPSEASNFLDGASPSELSGLITTLCAQGLLVAEAS